MVSWKKKKMAPQGDINDQAVRVFERDVISLDRRRVLSLLRKVRRVTFKNANRRSTLAKVMDTRDFSISQVVITIFQWKMFY